MYSNLVRAAALSMLLVGVASCGNESEKKSKEPAPVKVRTVTVNNGEVREGRSFSGTVEESSATTFGFSTGGTIKSLSVSEGDRVRKGQLIGVLDDGSLRNGYQIALATLNQAKDAYNRMKLLHDANSLPEIKWVEVESKLSQAQSAADIARIALNDAKLYSPVSGIVSEKMVSVGQTVAPGMPAVKIVEIGRVNVCISVPENEISNYPKGLKASISSRAADGATFSGILSEKSVDANPLSRSYTAKFSVDNSAGKLLPGMICDVIIDRTSTAEGIILPVNSVLLDADNTNFVWLDSAGKARKRVVAVGEMLPEGVVITSGLGSGEKVIVAGTEKVSSGTKVVSDK